MPESTVMVIQSPHQYADITSHADLDPFDPQRLVSHRSDEHLALLHQDTLVARCSLWWKDTPKSPHGAVGLIGHYAAVNDVAARSLLEAATDRLSQCGCLRALAPVDQNTWRDYRMIVSASDHPPFLFEPYPGRPSTQPFTAAGFQPVAWYFSAMIDQHLSTQTPRVVRARARMQQLGIQVRTICLDNLSRQLEQLHAVTTNAFRSNPWYVPMSDEDFSKIYGDLATQLPLDFALIAEHNHKIVGFCFAVPDMLQPLRGETADTLIVKTLAVAPDRRYRGLGQVLLEEVHHRAFAAGMKRAIHALVREDAGLQSISRRYGRPFRRYALFGRELSS
ncbi:MAG: GNAT family N-acetyltransferase [Planctomycetales bacterium]|nr:GNAT family N-acetyltransferase [Planctomycetales bacterium]